MCNCFPGKMKVHRRHSLCAACHVPLFLLFIFFLLQYFLHLLIPVTDRILIQDWVYCSVVVRSCHCLDKYLCLIPRLGCGLICSSFCQYYTFCVIFSFEAKISLFEGWHKKQDLSSSSLVRWTFLIFPASFVTENEVHFQNTPLNMFCTLLWNSYHFLPPQFCRELLILKISEIGEICRNITL